MREEPARRSDRSAGYRVKSLSPEGVRFRQRATALLKQQPTQRYAVDRRQRSTPRDSPQRSP